MERVHGVQLAGVWASLVWLVKVFCVLEVASVVAQLFAMKYDAIGNLFHAKGLPIDAERTSRNNATKSNLVVLDRMVSMEYFWVKHIRSDVHRGALSLQAKTG